MAISPFIRKQTRRGQKHFCRELFTNQNYIWFIKLGDLSPEIQYNTRVIYSRKKTSTFFLLKPISGERLNRSRWNLVHLCIGPRRIQENCFRNVLSRAFYTRKTCCWGSRKSCFSWITFFFVDVGESGQSKVCSASDAWNFGTKFVGIEALWPRFWPDRKFTRLGPHVD